MAAATSPNGAWEGSLIDALGMEGRLRLELSGRAGKARGRFVATIAGHHQPFVRAGEVSGTVEKGVVELQLTFPRAEGEEVRIVLHGRVFELSDSGVGMCGTYEVAARSFSPLHGGVIALSRDRAVTTVEARGGAA